MPLRSALGETRPAGTWVKLGLWMVRVRGKGAATFFESAVTRSVPSMLWGGVPLGTSIRISTVWDTPGFRSAIFDGETEAKGARAGTSDRPTFVSSCELV